MSSTKKALGRRRLLKSVGGAVGAAAAAGSLGIVFEPVAIAKPRAKTVKPATGVDTAQPAVGQTGATAAEEATAPAHEPELVSRAVAEAPVETEPVPAPPSEAVRAMFGRLGPGDVVGTCTIVSVHDVLMGAVPVVLETRRGHRFQVDVLRRDLGKRSPAGVANTRAYSLYLSNGGSGGTKTREEIGLGVMALASALRGRAAAAPGELLTLRERHARFPEGWFVVT